MKKETPPIHRFELRCEATVEGRQYQRCTTHATRRSAQDWGFHWLYRAARRQGTASMSVRTIG